MKKKVIVDLITAYYENDPRLFFQRTIDVLKEFKEDGDDALIEHLDFILKSKVKIAPKREVTKLEDLHEEISFEEAEKLGWIMVPQSDDPLITNKEDMEFQRKQEETEKRLGFTLNDMLKAGEN